MKILLISDDEKSYLWDHFDAEPFKGIELIISAGDLEVEYLSYIVTVIKAPLFYVHGNHDTSYARKPPEGCDCIDDKLVKYKDLRILGLGGSKRYNENELQYTEKEMKKRVTKLNYSLWRNKGFDILVTHSAAYGRGDGNDLCHEGFQCFNDLLDRYSPKYYIHGHQHLTYGHQQRIINYKNTTIINAHGYHILEY